MVPLEKVNDIGSWEPIRSIAFGNIEDAPVTLSVYQEKDEQAWCGFGYERIALLEYQGEMFRYPNGCMSTSFDSAESPEQNMYLFEPTAMDQKNTTALHGAVELSANGPGRMLYYSYDETHKQWFGFEKWGTPLITDLDQDGKMELIVQFHGLHMQWPDVAIYRWSDVQWETIASIKEAIGVPNISISEAHYDPKANQIIVVAIVDQEHQEKNVTAVYNYKKGEVLKVK